MALIGDLRDIRIQDILRFVKRVNKSGVLIIKGKSEGEIYFKEGKIVNAKIGKVFVKTEEILDKCSYLLSQKEGEFRLEPQEEIEVKTEIDPDAILKKIK
ncbi:MAG: DUF4388 domain-containing protein [candidate division WOR-3 bacterium]